jgi:2-keto-4-pentenoate hydratase
MREGKKMTDQEIAACAEALLQARRSGPWIEALPATPSSVTEAHAIQNRVAARLGQSIGGFKANAPPDQEPTRGFILAGMIRQSPAAMAVAEVPHCGVEGEIAFRFTRDLPARLKAYDREEVAGAVTALPVIEVVSGRFRDPRSRPPLEQLADCVANGGLVTGTELSGWSHLDLARLRVTLLVNGTAVVERAGGHPLDDPLHVAVALVNMMRGAGGVTAGQLVTTGSWTGLRFLKPGDHCTVRFEGLGSAEVSFEG